MLDFLAPALIRCALHHNAAASEAQSATCPPAHHMLRCLSVYAHDRWACGRAKSEVWLGLKSWPFILCKLQIARWHVGWPDGHRSVCMQPQCQLTVLIATKHHLASACTYTQTDSSTSASVPLAHGQSDVSPLRCAAAAIGYCHLGDSLQPVESERRWSNRSWVCQGILHP